MRIASERCSVLAYLQISPSGPHFTENKPFQCYHSYSRTDIAALHETSVLRKDASGYGHVIFGLRKTFKGGQITIKAKMVDVDRSYELVGVNL
ncbi:hypothetical protein BDR04DRAFT_1108765 [Suillus decipiens]|nr:hypothetical protein BDR04DRAFT_1108765 [Suillus decipiens]